MKHCVGRTFLSDPLANGSIYLLASEMKAGLQGW